MKTTYRNSSKSVSLGQEVGSRKLHKRLLSETYFETTRIQITGSVLLIRDHTTPTFVGLIVKMQ